ncbi:WAT1-related protein [Apostasia shenzhenica]|uniref:WAT1-related protein n=1 Tax=Apostasia shenzhenica TaxID=1088818 RepID=A0A2I0A0Y2_9ASPA|nr:WAT1-related protein [Apostasia shenzhenica]
MFHLVSMGYRGFCLVFMASLVGATLNQYCYYQGLKKASTSIATAMTNLIPAITFIMSASIGYFGVDPDTTTRIQIMKINANCGDSRGPCNVDPPINGNKRKGGDNSIHTLIALSVIFIPN